MIDRFSGLLGLFAFFLTSSIGLLMGKSDEQVLFSSLVAMVTFVILGKILGYVAKRIVAEVVADMPEEELAGIEAEELVEGKAAVLGEPGELEEPLAPTEEGGGQENKEGEEEQGNQEAGAEQQEQDEDYRNEKRRSQGRGSSPAA